jgi:hypothetical protein
MNKKICISRNGKYYTNYKYCIEKTSIPQDYQIDDTDIIGSGSYGVVLGGRMNGKSIAIKMIPLDVEIPNVDCGLKIDGGDCLKYKTEDFKNEVDVSKTFGRLGITPIVYMSDIVDLSNFTGPTSENRLSEPEKIGVIIFERFGKSLDQWIRYDSKVFMENEWLIKTQFRDFSKEFFNLGYFNLDSHFGNILFDDKTKKVKLLDLDLQKTNLSWSEIDEKLESGWMFNKKRYFRKYGLEDESSEEEESEDEYSD